MDDYMRIDDEAIRILFDYIKIKGEVPGVLTYTDVHEWLKSKGITFRQIDNEPYWSKSCEDDCLIFHTDRGGDATYIKVWTKKASKLIGFKLDHNEAGDLMMNIADQQSLSDDIKEGQNTKMRKAENNRYEKVHGSK
jgi:hypothetical protein